MARKAGYRHIDETRAKIQVSQIITRLTKHMMSSKPIMDASQVNAAKTLLAKVLPDLQAVSLSGETTVHNRVSNKPMTEAEWASEHGADD